LPKEHLALTDPLPSAVRRQLLQRLESLQRAGVECLPRPDVRDTAVASQSDPEPDAGRPPSTAGTADAVSSQPATLSPSLFTDQPEARPAMNRHQRQEALDIIQAEVAKCTRCDELACTRTQTVFGVGNPQARLAFLGEAPGADEDRQGEPFVGRAGQLLNKIIEACTLRREDVYILNILKCRPPGNRNPSADEAANCRDFLIRQLDILQPEYLCCLGAVAAQNLLDTTVPIGKLRGRFHQFRGIKVMATYHPAYLLRNPNAKRATWDDMKMLMADMGITLK
jgi:DNA polymerase